MIMGFTADDVKGLEALNIQIMRELEASHAQIEADCMSFMIARNNAASMGVYFDMNRKLDACTEEYMRFFTEMASLRKRAAGLI